MKKRRENRRPERRFGAKDFLGILLGLFLFFGVPNLLLGLTDKMGEPGTYNMYAGPVMPLSSISGGEGVEASRHVTLDFEACREPSDFLEVNRVGIVEDYELHNPSSEPVSMELVLTCRTSLSGDAPVIRVNGSPVGAQVRLAMDPEGGLSEKDDFEAYSKVLTEGDYLAGAMAGAPAWEVPVKVYHFHSMAYEGDAEVSPMLDIGYQYGKNTNLWVRTHYAVGYDGKTYHVAFDTGSDVWLYVIGDDLKDMTVGGSKVHTQGVYQATAVEGLTYELDTYESTFAQCLWDAAQDYQHDWEAPPGSAAELVTPELLYDYAMKRVAAEGEKLPGMDSMNSIFRGVYEETHLTYWVFPVEIPAGGSVSISAVYDHQMNWNTFSEEEIWERVEIATLLGSNLNIREQTAAIIHLDRVTIAAEGTAQNFGFDPAAGITLVELDPETECYYLDMEFLE